MTTTPLPTDAELKDLIARLRTRAGIKSLAWDQQLLIKAADALERLSPQVEEDVIERAAKEAVRLYGDYWTSSQNRQGFVDGAKFAARLLSSPREDEMREALQFAKVMLEFYAHVFRYSEATGEWVLDANNYADLLSDHGSSAWQAIEIISTALASTPSSPAGDAAVREHQAYSRGFDQGGALARDLLEGSGDAGKLRAALILAQPYVHSDVKPDVAEKVRALIQEALALPASIPAPVDREAVVKLIRQHCGSSDEYGLADAILALFHPAETG